MGEPKGLGRALLAAVLMFLDGVLNIIYGLAAIGDSKFVDHPTHYLLGTLHEWGWISLTLGILQLVAAASLIHGHKFGRYFGIAVAALVAIGALLDIPAQPLWSLAVFGLTIWIIQGLTVYSEPDRRQASIG